MIHNAKNNAWNNGKLFTIQRKNFFTKPLTENLRVPISTKKSKNKKKEENSTSFKVKSPIEQYVGRQQYRSTILGAQAVCVCMLTIKTTTNNNDDKDFHSCGKCFSNDLESYEWLAVHFIQYFRHFLKNMAKMGLSHNSSQQHNDVEWVYKYNFVFFCCVSVINTNIHTPTTNHQDMHCDSVN